MSLSLFVHSAGDSITVAEARSQAGSLSGRQVTVEGRVGPRFVAWDAEAGVMRFALIGNGGRLDVSYHGVVPDRFKPGDDLVVAGRFGPGGGFEALSFPARSLCNLCH